MQVLKMVTEPVLYSLLIPVVLVVTLQLVVSMAIVLALGQAIKAQ